MFLVFAGACYYPSGGWHDYRGSAPTLVDALELIANLEFDNDWWHVVSEGKIVKASDGWMS